MQCKSLSEVRNNIDRIDSEIIKLIAERSQYVTQAAKLKKDKNDVRDVTRVEKVIENVRKKATVFGADPNMIEILYREMITMFVNMEMAEYEGNQND